CSGFRLPWGGLAGPTSFGSGGPIPITGTGSGDLVGLAGVSQALFTPVGYVFGNHLSNTATFAGQSFASLGATPGTYVWTWGTGADADNFTLQIGPAAAPEPTSLALLGVGLAALGMALRTRRV